MTKTGGAAEATGKVELEVSGFGSQLEFSQLRRNAAFSCFGTSVEQFFL